MGDGMSDAYKAERSWRRGVQQLKDADKKALENDPEYNDLVAAHKTIVYLLKQQLGTYNEIQNKRLEILNKYTNGYVDASLADLDSESERGIISPWALRDLIKSL